VAELWKAPGGKCPILQELKSPHIDSTRLAFGNIEAALDVNNHAPTLYLAENPLHPIDEELIVSDGYHYG
jgi:hypothetical protein